MSGSIFGSEDPWENGWAAEDSRAATSPFASTQLKASALSLSGQIEEEDENDSSFVLNEAKIPLSYKTLYNRLRPRMKTGSDFEEVVLNKLVENHLFLGFQRTKIINTIYDHNLSDVEKSTMFYQCIGLVALELDIEGTGDYVTLQFKVNDLPPIDSDVVQLLVEDKPEPEIIDPLTSQLANSGISNDNEWHEREANTSSKLESDPVLTDHSGISNSSGQTPAGFKDLNNYINEYRSQFKPLFDGNDVINVKEVPEKEGLLFKHINYAISHQINLGMNSAAGPKKVIRRYSDFVWYV